MLKEVIISVNIISFILFVYGVYITFAEIEPNVCQMTYMFEAPQFTKIRVTKKKFFSNYGLYYYNEGRGRTDTKSLNGAPVLFVPGNGGSYRQVRSLASVALRMKMKHKNDVHLDYFTIDYAEELSAIYGGYLDKQKYFLQLCLRTIVDLYQRPSNETVKIAIVGHSMGGVVAKSILTEEKYKKHISNIIFLSTPIDRPVVNFDSKLNRFYGRMNSLLQERPYINESTDLMQQTEADDSQNSKKVLLISIGGGVRDLQVPAWLTKSQHSTVHSMTSAIPNVWLSCDHLSIVWCLQLVKVINRFFFSIVVRQPDNYVIFQEDFESNFQSAYKYFVGKRLDMNPNIQNLSYELNSEEVWHAETSRQIFKTFTRGLQQNYNQLLPLEVGFEKECMYIEIIGEEMHDWLFGCIAEEQDLGKLACRNVFSLAHYISWIPTEKSKKSYALLDIPEIKKNFSEWTHVLIRLPASSKSLSLRVDIYNASERYIHLKPATWFDINERIIISKTQQGAAFTKVIIENISDSYSSILLNLQKLDCTSNHVEISIRVSASWEKGFDTYHVFGREEQKKSIIANSHTLDIPITSSTQNLLIVNIHLDPICQLGISQQLSFKGTMRRIIQRSFGYLPAYLTAIFLLLMAQEISKKKVNDVSLLNEISSEFVQPSLLLFVITCNVFLEYQTGKAGDLPISHHSYRLLMTILLQVAAVALTILTSLSVLLFLKISASVLMFITPKLSGILNLLTFPYFPKIFTSRLTLGIAIISTTLVTCSGLGITLTYLVYFFWITSIYQLGSYQTVNTTAEIVSSAEKLHKQKQHSNLMFHFKLLQLLFVLTVLNASEVIAWVIKYPQLRRSWFTDFQSNSSMVILLAWAVLWEMEDLNFLLDSRAAWLILYCGAASSFLYVGENVYRLNYVICCVYVSLVLIGLLHKLRKFWKMG